MDLNADFHGVPLKYWLVGASATGFLGFVLYRRRKAAKAAASAASNPNATGTAAGATGPLPGWASLAGALGPLGGSSPTGPLTGYTSSGEPVYGTITDKWRRRSHTTDPAPGGTPDGSVTGIFPGETTPTAPVLSPVQTLTPFLATPPASPAIPVYTAQPAPPPPATYVDTPQPSYIAQPSPVGSPTPLFSYGGNPEQAASLVGTSPGVYVPFDYDALNANLRRDIQYGYTSVAQSLRATAIANNNLDPSKVITV